MGEPLLNALDQDGGIRGAGGGGGRRGGSAGASTVGNLTMGLGNGGTTGSGGGISGSEELGPDSGSSSRHFSGRARRFVVGIILMTLIAFSWVGTLHLLKMAFILGRNGTFTGAFHSIEYHPPPVRYEPDPMGLGRTITFPLVLNESEANISSSTTTRNDYLFTTTAKTTATIPPTSVTTATTTAYTDSTGIVSPLKPPMRRLLEAGGTGGSPPTSRSGGSSVQPFNRVKPTGNPVQTFPLGRVATPHRSGSSSDPVYGPVTMIAKNEHDTHNSHSDDEVLTGMDPTHRQEPPPPPLENNHHYDYSDTNDRGRALWRFRNRGGGGMSSGSGRYPGFEPSGHSAYYSRNLTSSLVISPDNVTFDAPFFVTWFCSIWNVLFLPIFTLLNIVTNKFDKDNPDPAEEISFRKIYTESVSQFMDRGYSPMQFFGRCAFFCVLWMLTNYALIYTLRFIDTTVVMSLFACTITMMYLLSWVVLHQQFVGIRIVAAIICDTGIAFLAYSDGVQQTSTLAGVMLSTGAALGAAVYKVLYQRMVVYSSFAQMSLFFSLVGLFNFFFMWPLVLILYLFNVEVIQGWHSIPWMPIVGAATLLLVANVLGNFGILWTYDVFLTLGLLIAIPISSMIDTTIYAVEFRGMKLAGIILIMIGFCVVLLPDNWNEYLSDLLRERIAKWKAHEQRKKNGQVQDTTSSHLSRLRTSSGRVK